MIISNFYLLSYALVLFIEHTETFFVQTAELLLICLKEGGFFNNLQTTITRRDSLLETTDLLDKMKDINLNAEETSEENSKNTGSLSDMISLESAQFYIGGLLLRHICQLVCNAHAITELQAANVTNQSSLVESKSQVRIATAIYPTTSLLNHSCDPTIISR